MLSNSPDHEVGLGEIPAVGVGGEGPRRQRRHDLLLLTKGLQCPGEISLIFEA